MNVVEVSFLSFAFFGLLLAFFFFTKRKGDRVANRILGIYLILFAYNITWNCVYWANLIQENHNYAHMIFTNNFPWISYGPLFYLYLRRVIKKSSITWVHGLHFLPLLLIILDNASFLFLNTEAKMEAYITGNLWSNGILTRYLTWFIILQILIYGLLSFSVLKKEGKSLDRNKRIWLQLFISFFFGYWMAFTSYFVLSGFGLINKESDYIIGYIIVFFIGMVAYFGFRQPEVFNGLPIEKVIPFIKYKKTGLTKSHSSELKERLEQIMLHDKPFLENDLRLSDLARSLNLSRHHMSQVINEHFNISFFDYINQYRIDEAKELLLDNSDDLNITQVAYSVGFNNRVSFYKAFKKFTGTTPSDFISVHSHHAS